MKIFHYFRSFVLWALEIILVVIWLSTLWQLALDGKFDDIFWAIVIVGLLIILYFAEGIELAVADLLDKQPEQLSNEIAQDVLREIQEKRGFFFSQRQIFVVVIIAFMSLMLSYDWLYIPGVGKNYELSFWFSFIFTTLTVLWFCQVTPKRLAVINSERFLMQSMFLWPIIKLLGTLGLLAPSDHIVALMEKWSGYRQKRHLRPSRAAQYNIMTHLYGFSLDRRSVEVSIRDDGSATFVQKLLVLFVRGKHTFVYGNLYTHSFFVEPPRIKLVALFTRSVPEQFDTIAKDLDAIFDGYEPEQGNGFSGNLLPHCAYEVEVGDGENIYPNGEEASWIIKILHPLPESLWSQADLGDDEQQPFVALMYSVEAEVAEGAFPVPGTHHWDEYIQFPCRDLLVSVCGAPGTEVAIGALACEVSLHNLSAPLPEETERCKQSIRSAEASGKKVVRTRYPLQGGIYRTHWKTMRTVGTDPCTM